MLVHPLLPLLDWKKVDVEDEDNMFDVCYLTLLPVAKLLKNIVW